MALVTCPDCGKKHSDQAKSCPECGRPYSAPQPQTPPLPPAKKKGGCLKTALIAVGLLLLVGIIAGAFQEPAPEEVTLAPRTPAPEAEPAAEPAPAAVSAAARPGRVLKWKELSSEKVVRAAINRDRLFATIVLTEDQSNAAQADLAATAMQAAETYQERTGLPVIFVRLLAYEPKKEIGETVLAVVSYIPDQKGPGGQERGLHPFKDTMAVPRGFTAKELEYLRLREAMYDQYIDLDGGRGDKLREAVLEKMGAGDDLNPGNNFVTLVDLE